MRLAAHWTNLPTNRTPSIVRAEPEAGKMGPEDTIKWGHSGVPFRGRFHGPLTPVGLYN